MLKDIPRILRSTDRATAIRRELLGLDAQHDAALAAERELALEKSRIETRAAELSEELTYVHLPSDAVPPLEETSTLAMKQQA